MKCTPENLTHLEQDEIYVFGSNVDGIHDKGDALIAYKYFGAVMGQNSGLQGQSYAIPTMNGDIEKMKPYIQDFFELAGEWDQTMFYVTRIGSRHNRQRHGTLVRRSPHALQRASARIISSGIAGHGNRNTISHNNSHYWPATVTISLSNERYSLAIRCSSPAVSLLSTSIWRSK